MSSSETGFESKHQAAPANSGEADKAVIEAGTLGYERARVLFGFNETAVPYRLQILIHELFEEQVARTPNYRAVVYEGEYLTYAELNARANRLARHLRRRGVGPDRLVGMCLERSFEMIVGLLGILKAGGAYVPIDPDYPAERIDYVLRDAALTVVVSQANLQGRLRSCNSGLVVLDGDWREIAKEEGSNLDKKDVGTDVDDLAYVIYTSGSTGRPKGAMNEHGAVVNRLMWMQGRYELGERDRVLQKTPFSFDVSVWEFFWPLMQGARLILARPRGHRDPSYLMDLIEETDVTTLHFVPSMLEAFLSECEVGECESIRHIICSGEELPVGLQNNCLERFPRARMSNLYGPTECAVDVTAWECERDDTRIRVPIGRPAPNNKIYILDSNREPVPVGQPGEIYIGGVQVGRGYLNLDRLTAERFLADPFSGSTKGRMYRTGDVGRWLEDGAVEYLRRNDAQIKLRGFRIELGEIEVQLQQHAEVREAAVTVREDREGNKRLVGYVTARDHGQAPSQESLREYLRARLPDYMVPNEVVVLAELPLTHSGKLDRQALLALPNAPRSSREYEAPRGDVEKTLAGIWQELLQIDAVGRNDDIFALGGNSLVILRVVERLRRIGFVSDAHQCYERPTVAELALTLGQNTGAALEVPPNRIPLGAERITPEMLTLLQLEPRDIECILRVVPGGASNLQDVYPLGPLQHGMLFHHLLNPLGNDPYVISTLMSVSSRELLEEFVRALQAVVDRHDALRSAVVWESLPQPVQVVVRKATLPVEVLTLDQNRDPVEEIKQQMGPGRHRIDLGHAPLARLKVAADPRSQRWYVLLQMHHLVCDEQSWGLMLAEVKSFLDGKAKELSDPQPYRNHVARALALAHARDAQSFFRTRLRDVTETSAPYGIVDIQGDGSRVIEERVTLDTDLAARLRSAARTSRVSAATLFHAAWALVVSCTSGCKDVVYGTVLLGRLQGSGRAEGTLGVFINTLPLRINIGHLSARALIERTHRELMKLIPYEQVSLGAVQRWRDRSSAGPLFTALINYRHSNAKWEEEWHRQGVDLLATVQATNYPVALSVDDLGTDFMVTAQTDERISPQYILGYLTTALNSLVQAAQESPLAPAIGLQVIPDSELKQVMEGSKGTHGAVEEALIHELFERQAASRADVIAVRCDGKSLTYRELNSRANKLARYLRGRGVAPDVVVGILVERSLEMIVAILGVLKAGGAYLPLDPTYPSARIAYMLEDSAPVVVLTQERLRERLSGCECEVVTLDSEWGAGSENSRQNLNARRRGLGSTQLAYVIYTSGSTGRPKGVMIEHRSVLNLWWGLERLYEQVGGCEKVALNAPTTFDASVQQIVQLLSGRTLYVVPEQARRDPEKLVTFIEQYGIDSIDCTPSHLRSWMDAGLFGDGRKVRLVLVGGEAIEADLWHQLAAVDGVEIYNVYGPTECTVDVSAARLTGDTTGPHIGRPMDNRDVYILDRDGRPVPIGVIGEIYVGGAGVARGYLNRPELTAERFLPDPFSADSRARMYKTGDLGRWRADGTIEYLGRNDEQVKIRGFRIELGEIEAQLSQYPQVREAVVLAREDVPGERRLVGYVVPKEGVATPSIESLREHLRRQLPEYMVPSAFVVLEALPLTPNGKLDRRGLPAPDLSSYGNREYEAPQGEVEEILAGIWQELLHLERVGRNDNFFELGGHSLLIVQVMERLRRVGLSAEVRRVFESPTLSGLASTLLRGGKEEIAVPPNLIPPGCEHITPEMLPLIELEQEHIDRIVQAVPGGAANIQDIYPLAPLQEGILFHHVLHQQRRDPYVVPTLFVVASRERLGALLSAFQTVMDRHDVLRTAVFWEALPCPMQVVLRRAALPVEEVVIEQSLDVEEEVRNRMRADKQKMDLRVAPLMRIKVVGNPCRAECYVLLQIHHIVCDNRSLDSMSVEIMTCLRGLSDQLPSAIHYREHVAQTIAYARLSDSAAFFRKKLSDVDETTAPFGVINIYGGSDDRLERAVQVLQHELSVRVRGVARRLGVSVAAVFHAAWALVVARTAASDDVVFGTVILGRFHSEVAASGAIGMFINTLPVRLPLKGVRAAELVECTQREILGLINHEHASLVTAQRCSSVPGTRPLFTALLNYRHESIAFQSEQYGNVGVRWVASDARTNFPVLLSVDELHEGFSLTADSDEHVDPRRLVAYMNQAVRSLVVAIESNAGTPALSLAVIPEAERQLIIEGFNATAVPVAAQRLVHELFEKQAERTPDAVAVEHEGRRLTYAELNRRANQLARYLVSLGLGPDEVVGICIERSVEMVVGLLAILKAGGAYLPLDPNYPADRLKYMLEDAAPRVVLTETELMGVLPTTKSKVAALDEKLAEMASNVDEDLRPADLGLSAENLVYVIYTSGSTGSPKGTAMRHRSVVNLIDWHRHTFGSGEGRRVLQFAALSFDVAFQEIFSTLCTGGTLVLLDEWVRRDAGALTELLVNRSIQRLFVPPLMLQSLAEYSKGSVLFPLALKDVITAGEQLRISSEVREFFGRLPGCRLHNHYGPTETHVVTALTLEGDPRQWADLPPIGRPIANIQIYVLDGRMQPVPIGVSGEIYIGGAAVARGYLNRPELTEQRFVSDPYSSDPLARLYKTGDLGVWREDGVLEYLGRNDDQVKIRGFRVELKEIELQLARHDQVREVAAMIREDNPGEKRLVAYVTARQEVTPSAEELRAHLKVLLPEHMVPSAFVVLEKLPLTPSGKLDRRGLPPPDQGAYASRQYVPPQGEVEEILAGIWQEVLRVERVGRNDNFFELGGHSLLIVQLMERLRRVGLSAEVRRVFESPALSDLAGALVRRAEEEIQVPPNLIPPGCKRIVPGMLPLVELEQEHIDGIARAISGGAENIQDIYPLAPLQEGILFHHLLSDEGGDAYVLPLLFSVSSEQKLQSFISALQHVISRHDILRTAVLWEHLSQPVQVVLRQATLPVEELDLEPSREPLEQIRAQMRPELLRLDLRKAPLMRVQIAAGRSGERYALVKMHHFLCDHESLETLLAEVATCLEERAEELPKPMAFRKHVAQALAYARAHDAEAFFTGKLVDIEEPTAPFGLLDVHGDGSRIRTVKQILDQALDQRIRNQARRMGVTAATLFHAAWALVVSSTSRRDDVVYGTLLSGRVQGTAGAERTLGMFINTLPLRVRLHGVTAKELVEQTQREIVDLLNYEQASLAVAQRCSSVVAPLPLFTSLLNYRHSTVDLDSGFAKSDGVRFLDIEGWTNYPVAFMIEDFGDQFVLDMETDYATPPLRVMSYAMTAIRSLVDALERSPATPALSLAVIPEAERQLIIEGFNATAVPVAAQRLVHELFEKQAERTPDAVAVEHEGRRLTYAELNRRANQLARYLLGQGAGPDQIVGICAKRGLEMVVGVLGIMKTGSAYLPLDPNYPADRLKYMLEDAAPRVVLTETELMGVLPTTKSKVAALDEKLAEMASNVDEDLRPADLGLSAENLVYVIYTSGSTGRPKGTAMRHRSMVNLVEWHRNTFGSGEGQKVLQFAALSFDVAFQETFSTLCTGGTLVLLDEWVRRDAQALAGLLRQQAIHRLFVPPLMLQSVAEYCKREFQMPHRLRDVITAGEQLRISSEVREFFGRLPGCRLHNHYGPTETHVVTALTLEGDPRQWADLPPIGRPIANIQIYVLDGRMQPVPIGVSGEIYIGGAAVARGYLNRPELTEQRFVSDPYSSDPLARLYKTGDLGVWREDGVLEYLGRNDDQVKIRGFRVELKEIELQLARHDQVREVAAMIREDNPGEKRLVAYVTARQEVTPSAEELRAHLKVLLPEHMVPSAFVVLEKLPLTPSGKLDRRGLPPPDQGAYASRQYVPPQGEVEEILAGIWQEVLRVECVGRNDNFFELGGHSLLIVQLMERLRRVGLSAEVRRVFESPALSDLAGALVRRAEEEIQVPPNLIPPGCKRIVPGMLPLVELEQEHIDGIARAISGGAENIQDIYPLAPLQEGILFHHLLSDEGGDAYVLPLLFSVSSEQKLQSFISALQHVISRHDILRTAVLWEHLSQPVQVVLRQATLPVEELDLEPSREPLEQIRAQMRPELLRLDLRKAPLMRVQIAAGRSGERYALVKMHHFLCDHESLETLLAEVATCLEERAEELPKPMAFRKHVAQALAYARAHDAEAFFTGKLVDIEEPTAPFGLLDVHGDGSRIRTVKQILDQALDQRIRNQARRMGVTAATLFHAAWALVVSSTSRRDDVVYGTLLSGRVQGTAGAERTLGMFINTLPLRVRLHGVTAKELVEQTQREIVDLLNYEQASLAVAQRCSSVVAPLPLFTSLLNYRHSTVDLDSGFAKSDGVRFLDIEGWTNYPVVFMVGDVTNAFTLDVETDLASDPLRVMSYAMTAIRSLVDALERSPATPALSLAVIPEAERQLIIEGFNATAVPVAAQRLVHELFEKQAERTPDAVAVEHEGRRLTYAELNRRANQLARYLVSLGLGPDEVVGICIERSVEMVVGLLAILKAGGAYLPLDPNYPADRLKYMLEDAAPRVVLTETELMGVLPTTKSKVAALDEKLAEMASNVDEDLRPADLGLSAENLVYVIYTSGSTGSPKGTAMRHRSVVNLIDWHRHTFGSGEGRRVLQFAALSFDVAFQEIFSTLCTGGTLVLLDEWVRRDAGALTELLVNRSIQRLFVPPLMLQSLAEYSKGSVLFPLALKDVITAGEQLRISSEVREFFGRLPGCRLHNHYGPTETHVVTALTLEGDPRQWADLPPIGRPIANIQIYVLDGRMQPVPIGVSGEIYIGGAAVARGYLNRPELTEQRFVSDPYSSDPLARLYKTGDLGVWREDGVLEYLGRNDDQVKIRGFRVELKEIELQLARHDQVREVAAMIREDNPGEKRLVAYVTARQEVTPSAEELRAHLKVLLPEHMVPSAFVVLEKLPLTPSGKLDRRGLPPPDQGAYASRQYVPPQGEVEEILAGIWQEVLRVERVGRNDNFFELGGHSLSAAQVIVRARSLISTDASIRVFFRYPTLQQLGAQISEMRQQRLLQVLVSDDEHVRQIMDKVRGLSDEEVQKLTRGSRPGAAS